MLGFYRDYYEVHCFGFIGHTHIVSCVVFKVATVVLFKRFRYVQNVSWN